jgi:hypothetical protein
MGRRCQFACSASFAYGVHVVATRDRRFTDRHRSARSQTLPRRSADLVRKMAICPKLIVPLQIDLAMEVRRYLLDCWAN